MIFGLIKQVSRKPKEFYYRPISYDPDKKAFHDKVLERGKQNSAQTFNFRAHQKAANRTELKNRTLRFAIIFIILLYLAYAVLTSEAIEGLAKWLVNG